MHRYSIVLTALLLSACVHVEQYPASWGQTTTSTRPDDCPLINGAYDNNGEKPDGTVVYFATWLKPTKSSQSSEERLSRQKMWDDLFGAKTVRLDLTNEVLLTVTASGDNINRQWSYDKLKREFTCHNGVLSVAQGGDMSGDNVAAFGSGAIDLYRTEGHLAVNSHGFTAGVMLLIPAAAYGSDWARFAIQK